MCQCSITKDRWSNIELYFCILWNVFMCTTIGVLVFITSISFFSASATFNEVNEREFQTVKCPRNDGKKKEEIFLLQSDFQVIKSQQHTKRPNTYTPRWARNIFQAIEFWLSYFFFSLPTLSLTVQVIWQEKGKFRDQIVNHNAINNDSKATTTPDFLILFNSFRCLW